MKNNIKEKQEKLEVASSTLKKEFVGIDHIIDQIIENITPWFVTPEIITRPISISLWGLTGTGKTSVVKRLIELLEVEPCSLYFNCATEASTNKETLDSKLETFFDEDSESASLTISAGAEGDFIKDPSKAIIILDEFQNCRTIDEDSREKDRSQTSVIWQLLDSGHVEVLSYSWERSKLISAIEDLLSLSRINPNIPLVDGKFGMSGEELERIDSAFREYLDFHGLYYFKSSSKPSLSDTSAEEDSDDEKKDIEFPPVININTCERHLIKTYNYIGKGEGWNIRKRLHSAETLGEYCQILQECTKIISKPRKLDFSKALVFVIGNLDEAFGVGEGIDPDIDADILNKLTTSVTITEVKSALKKRFRLEQISRLGNNMILYPSLKKKDFKEIIEMELEKASQKFFELTGFKIEFSDNMKELIYSESVYPIQGVRPIHSTISSLLIPKFSKVLLGKPGEAEKAVLDTKNREFEKESIEILVSYDKGPGFSINQELTLGSLRDISKYPKILLHSVHEAGHAVVYSILTGKMPETIVAITAQGGGYMWEDCSDSNSHRQSQTVEDMETNIMVSLAGALAEKIIFGVDPKKLSLGASSDISNAWDNLSHAFYDCGIGGNLLRYRSVDAYPRGIDPFNIPDEKSRDSELIRYNNKLISRTQELLIENIDFLKSVAKFLGEHRKMSRQEFKEFYDLYCRKKTQDISEWYREKLE